MKRRLVGLLCGFIACLGWHMAQAGAQELEVNLPVEFETLQIIMTDEHQTWLAGYTGEPMSGKPAVLQVTSEGEMRCFEEDATDSSFFFSASLSPDRWILLRTEDGPTSPTEAVVMENGEVKQRIRGLGMAKGVSLSETATCSRLWPMQAMVPLRCEMPRGTSYGKWNCRICRGSAM